MRPKLTGGRRLGACLHPLRLLARGEEGIALIMALGTMLVLTIGLTTVIFFTASGARDAQRTNAGQKAYAIAEGGINNAAAVLNANYPGPSGSTYPYGGLTAGSISSGGFVSYPSGAACPSTTKNCVSWTGTLVQAPSGAGWGYQWNLTSTGDVWNPTGPAAAGSGDVTRTVTAVVPIVLPLSSSQSSSTSAINYIYGNNITFGQSVVVKAPVYAKGNLELANTATIAEDVPASQTAPQSQNTVDVGGNIALDNPQNQIGHIDSKTGALAHVEVTGTCSYQGKYTSPPGSCTPSGTGKNQLPIWADTIGNSPTYVTPPTMTCCSPVSYASPVTPNGSDTMSDMGEWYKGADLGPNAPCAPAPASSGSYASIKFDTGDGVMNQSAYSTTTPFNLVGSTYVCKSMNGQGELAWDGSTLTIKGTVFFDGSICICGTNAGGQYVGNGTIIATGDFTMGNNDQLCVEGGVSGKSCNQSVSWNPNDTSLGIIAYGDNGSGYGIVINKGSYQGLLMAYKSIDCSVAGTMVQGPVVSVTGDVSCGQAGSMYFPAIKYPTGGEQGFFGPSPQPVLLPPIQFGGS